MADPGIEAVADSVPGSDGAAELEGSSWFTPVRVVVLGAALMLLAGVVGYRVGLPDQPGAGSADVGFLHDMIAHHEQAVAMAFFTADVATDNVTRAFAKEILSAQQYEIGLMEAWLGRWGFERDSGRPTAMAWAGQGHPKESMPGMAAKEELDGLYAATGPDVDDRFLRLMIAHHSGAIPMAEAVLERGRDDDVRRLAERIIKNQRNEIQEMQVLRRRLGLPPAPVELTPMNQGTSGSGTSSTTHHGG